MKAAEEELNKVWQTEPWYVLYMEYFYLFSKFDISLQTTNELIT